MHAPHLQQDLQKIMRRCGRQCRGMGKVFVTLVRHTEPQLVERGRHVLPLAQAVQERLHRMPQLAEVHRGRMDIPLTAALEAHERITHQSRRLTQGKALPHCKIVNAYDPTIAPICKGKSHGPAQFGRQPGMIAEPAAGFIFAVDLPVGNPSAVKYVEPLVDKVQHAIARVTTRPTLAIHSLAGDLALNDASLREALHAQGILTVGIPRTIAPLPPAPTAEDIRRSLEEADLHHIRTQTQVQLAYACGYSRPVVESLMASLLCRGAGRLSYKGHRGVGDQIKVYGSDRRNMYSAVVPPGEVARGGIVTTIGHLAIFLASHLDGEERPHDHPGGLDGSESIGTARL